MRLLWAGLLVLLPLMAEFATAQKCGGQPEAPEHATIRCFKKRGTCRAMCEQGYIFSQKNAKTAIYKCEGGNWVMEGGEDRCSPACKPPCKNGGYCSAPNSCTCHAGYEGASCELPVCMPDCLNGGYCTAPNYCTCPHGYSGYYCERHSSFVNLLSSAVNATLDHQNCPMLYTRIGNHCIAFFSLAQVPWPEARQFCQSIYGDLLSFDDLQLNGKVHEYLKEKQLTTDYWLGGRYDMNNNGWTWLDGSPMPLGSPYWAERYSSSCVPRALPPSDPFSGLGQVMPGAPCYNYIQAPKQITVGYCAAITHEHFYYVSDEECTSHRSPLCVLNYKKLG